MRRSLLWVVALVLVLPGTAGGTTIGAPSSQETAPLFAAGGSAVTNGFFFPGTAIFDGEKLVGEPYEIEQGTDIEFTTTDGPLTLGNGHRIRSFKRKRGRPLFMSKMVYGPGSALVITSHLKPGKGEQPDGSYGYYCDVHTNMYGLLQITKG